ncbi:uncharacterized protein E0L32_008158 [Thyridium curvatum]|uniref:Uncharacterized protein n=1 Tax=Thyridium curvatum TaxID=1093900 RepID=A0A507AMA8_9PEZI|nr:uncharacterized protein E0L32_008158 [Thyridium curvatum]TPX10952.1 hypothetical protein E0L32_008158 [Thyridium curvatum]
MRTFDPPSPRYYKASLRTRGQDSDAMRRMQAMWDGISNCRHWGVTYGAHSWGYTVLRTIYSEESNELWPVALAKLERWVTQYFVHETRLAVPRFTDGSVNEEMGRRFVLETLQDPQSEPLQIPDMSKASRAEILALADVFDAWYYDVVGGNQDARRFNPRFWDFLVIDEAALRSLVKLPDELPPTDPAPREERRARDIYWDFAYVWLVDPQAARRYKGIDNDENYDGVMKLSPADIPSSWFERVAMTLQSDSHIFLRQEIPTGSGSLWYRTQGF